MFRSPDARYALVLFGLAVLLWLPRLNGPIDLRYDAGVYYVTGTALAQGKGYRLLNEPGEIEAVQYPPLLPAFVALHQRLLGTSDPAVVGRWLRWSYCLIFVVYVLVVYRVARLYLGPGHAFLVGLITTLYLQTLFLSDLLFAEVPFALATMLFVLANRRSDRPGSFLLTGLLGVAAFLLRTAGVALLAAWVAESLFQKKWKWAVLRAVAALLPLVLWQAYVGRVTSGEEYRHPAYAYQRAPYLYYNVSYAENIFSLADPFAPEKGRASAADLARRAGSNLALMPAGLGDGVTYGAKSYELVLQAARERAGLAFLPPWVAAVPLVAVGCLVIAGAGVLLARREWFVPLYLAASVGLICLTPWPGQFARYLTPLTPFLALCLVRLFVALGAAAPRCCPGVWPKAVRALFFLTLFGVLGTEAAMALHAYVVRHLRGQTYPVRGDQSEGRLFYYGQEWADFDAALAWLKGHAGPGDVVATTAPQWVYLQTGLPAVMTPMEDDPARAQEMLDSVPVQYVIVDELEFLDVSRRYAGPAIREHPGRWREVYAPPEGRTRVYQRVD